MDYFVILYKVLALVGACGSLSCDLVCFGFLMYLKVGHDRLLAHLFWFILQKSFDTIYT